MQNIENIRRKPFIELLSNISEIHIRPPFINRSSQSIARFDDHSRSPLRYPVLDHDSHIFIILVVLIPIIFTLILCIIVWCIHRYNKKKSQQNITNLSIKPINDYPINVSSIYFNPYYKPISFEELPPSYDIISKTKNDSSVAKKNNNNKEQF
ncbi:unnamed protein product [Rotaria sp. Silwood2]|nr:unnamed protein product [Rotaria sp. Silwood2]